MLQTNIVVNVCAWSHVNTNHDHVFFYRVGFFFFCSNSSCTIVRQQGAQLRGSQGRQLLPRQKDLPLVFQRLGVTFWVVKHPDCLNLLQPISRNEELIPIDLHMKPANLDFRTDYLISGSAGREGGCSRLTPSLLRSPFKSTFWVLTILLTRSRTLLIRWHTSQQESECVQKKTKNVGREMMMEPLLCFST